MFFLHRIIELSLQFHKSLGVEFLVLHPKLSMLNKSSYYDWSWCGSMNKGYFILVHWGGGQTQFGYIESPCSSLYNNSNNALKTNLT